MKNLDNYITEKLVIGKNIIHQYSKTIDLIGIYLGLAHSSPLNDKIHKIINDWVKENQVSDFIPAIDLESFNVIKHHKIIDDKYLSEVDTSDQTNEQCQYELDKCDEPKIDDEISLYTSPKIIALLAWFGAIYIIKK